MSTRANVIVTDGEDELVFYRHCDGYPDGALPSLTKFRDLVLEGSIRDNVTQACGWLILLGALEDGVCIGHAGVPAFRPRHSAEWKVGAYEPTTSIHSDIVFLYVVDLEKKEIRHRKVRRGAGDDMVVPRSFYSGCFNPIESGSRVSEKIAPVNGSCGEE
jgi:hypothetical protein